MTRIALAVAGLLLAAPAAAQQGHQHHGAAPRGGQETA